MGVGGGGQELAILIPLKFPLASSLRSNLERAYNPKIKRKRDRGSPCLRPLAEQNFPNGLPVMRMEKEGEDMHILIQFIQVW